MLFGEGGGVGGGVGLVTDAYNVPLFSTLGMHSWELLQKKLMCPLQLFGAWIVDFYRVPEDSTGYGLANGLLSWKTEKELIWKGGDVGRSWEM